VNSRGASKEAQMMISEVEVVGLLQFAVRTSATKVGVRDVEWKTLDELLDEIRAHDGETCRLLEAFIGAYMEWYRFHRRMDELGKQGQLDNEEQRQLRLLIERRDASRKAILQQLSGIGGKGGG
jgi:hypothetical protein